MSVTKNLKGLISLAENIHTDTNTLLAESANIVSVATPDASDGAWSAAAHRLFTATGTVMVRVFGVVTETLTSSATGEVGVAGATAGLIAQLSNMGTLAAGDIFINATTATAVPLGILSDYAVIANKDIDLKIGAGGVSNGAITFYCQWIPVSTGATVVAATWD